MSEAARPPRDSLVRSAPETELRDKADGMPTMVGHFARFNEWTTIDSAFEGTFRERIAPGAFKRTFTNSRNAIRPLFQHGKDPQIGDKVLGPVEVLREDETGAYYEVPLLDTSYNRDLVPGLRAGLYGASFRFSVLQEDWNQSPRRSADNPDGLPERTIREARVMEFGPVTFPAYAGATASVRSLTDDFLREVVAARAPAPEAQPHSDSATRGEPPPEAPPIAVQDPPTGGSLDSEEPAPVEYETIEDKRARVTELNEGLQRQAEAYPGVLPTDEQATFDADVTERDSLERDVKAWEDRQAVLRTAAATPANREASYATKSVNQINRKSEADIYSLETRATTLEGRYDEYRDDAMRIIDTTRHWHPSADVERTKDQLSNLIEYGDSDDKELARRMKITGSPTYRRAFEKIVKGRGTMSLTPEEQRGTALAVGVDGTGGFAVPFAFDPTVIAIGVNNGAVNPYRQVCRVVQIVGTDTWNALTATAVTATRTTEAAPAIEQGPTFAQPQYIVKRVQGQITASYEMFQDRTDLTAELSGLIQEAKDNEEETSWATGVGTSSASLGVGPVNGTSGAYTSITTATSVTLAALDADATEAALPVRHRFNAQWFLNRQSIRRFQTLETAGGKLFGGSQYQAVGNPALSGVGNTGLRILGYPVNESPSLPTAQTANIVIGTLLNVNSYVIVDRVGMSIQFIPWLINSSALATGQAAIYFMYRNDARPINVDAGRTLRYLT